MPEWKTPFSRSRTEGWSGVAQSDVLHAPKGITLRGMLADMIEEGPDVFMKRWRAHAADATLFARPEGSPLLEAEVGPVIVQLLERTNPYESEPGRARIIVNPTATVTPTDDASPQLRVPARGALEGQGTVIAAWQEVIVVDAGVPLVIAVEPVAASTAITSLAMGTHVTFHAEPPIHGFVVPPETRRTTEARAVDEAQ